MLTAGRLSPPVEEATTLTLPAATPRQAVLTPAAATPATATPARSAQLAPAQSAPAGERPRAAQPSSPPAQAALVMPAPTRPVLVASEQDAAGQPQPESAQTLAAATSAALKGQHLTLAEINPDTWPLVFAQLKLTGVSRSIASHCSWAGVDAAGLHLVLSSQQAALYNDEHRKRIEAALVDYVGQAVKVHLTQGEGASETPAARRLRLEDERKLAAISDFTSDPLVQALQERFAAEIDFDSITPLTPPQH